MSARDADLAALTAQVEAGLTSRNVFHAVCLDGEFASVRVPAIYQGITVAGLHIHFLTEDRRAGGHVLDVTVADAALRLGAHARFDLRLPTDPVFLETELTHGEDHRIALVEGGAPR